MYWCPICDITYGDKECPTHGRTVNKKERIAKEIFENIKTETIEGNGVKHDQGKLPWHLLPYDVIEEVVAVLDYGAKKYGERNWEKGFDWSRLFSAIQRHLKSFWQDGENDDPETGLSHLAHASCMILFLLAHLRRELGKDDRPTVERLRSD